MKDKFIVTIKTYKEKRVFLWGGVNKETEYIEPSSCLDRIDKRERKNSFFRLF